MARFFTLLLIPIATYSLQAIDKYSGKADHKGDVFNLGDLLADAGDDRLKNALKEFRDNQTKLAKAAVNLLSANDGMKDFDPKSPLLPNNQQLMMGVATSKTLIEVANDYDAALEEYKKFVNKTYKSLSPTRSMPRTMTDSFARCRDWADSSRVLAGNVQVYFEHLINNGAIPVEPSKAKELVAFLETKVRIKKEVVANQKIFDREKDKLKKAVDVLIMAIGNRNKAKAANDKANADLKAKTTILALRKSAIAEESGKLFFLNKRFIVIEGLVKTFATDTAAKDALNKASLALNAATNAFAVATNAVTAAKANVPKAASALTAATKASVDSAKDVPVAKVAAAKAQAEKDAADKAAKDAEVKAKKIAGDANKTKEEKDATNKDSADKRNAANVAKTTSDKAKAAEQAAVKVAADKAKVATDARAADTKAKAAVTSAVKAVTVRAKAIENAKRAEATAKREADTANAELITAQENASKVTADRVKAKPARVPAPNTANTPKVNGGTPDSKGLWTKFRNLREEDLREKYGVGRPSWKIRPGTAQEQQIIREWQILPQADREAYLLGRGIILPPPQPKPLPSAPTQVKPPPRQLANNQRPPMLHEKDAKKELGSLKVEKVKARLAFEEAVRQEIATDKLLVEAMNTLKKVKPVFEAAQIKLRDSTAKEARQRKEFNGAESKLRESKSDLNKVEFQIEENRVIAWNGCVRARESLRDGYVKPESELENDPVPFVRD